MSKNRIWRNLEHKWLFIMPTVFGLLIMTDAPAHAAEELNTRPKDALSEVPHDESNSNQSIDVVVEAHPLTETIEVEENIEGNIEESVEQSLAQS